MHLASSLDVNISATIRDVLLIGVALLIVILLYVWLHRHSVRPIYFYAISALSFVILTVIAIATVVLHSQSVSLGRQHRQANIEFWVCGTEISPLSRRHGLINKLGDSSFYYRSVDKQLTRSGYVLTESADASLGAFFQATGGSIQSDNMVLPLSSNEADWLMPAQWQDGDPQGNMTTEFLQRYVQSSRQSWLELSDGLRCPDGSSGKLQLFVYEINHDDQTYQQRKVERPDNFIIEQASRNNPSQCLIIEFSESKERTNKLCQPIGIRDSLRCSEFGIEKFNENVCYLEEVTVEEQG